MHLRRGLGLLAVLPLLAAPLACAPTDESSDASSDGSSAATPTTSGSASGSTQGTDVPSGCDPESTDLVNPGQLTIGTDSPAYDPWFQDNDPTNGKGFESALAYAIADYQGFTPEQVKWVTVPFNTSYKPGEKNFDFDINQISITPQREQVVDFSDGYYTAAQAVIALKGSDIASATSLAALKDYKLGAQTGTTSLTVIRDQVQPGSEPLVFEDTNAAKQALLNGQVDGIVADLPTAFYISAAEIEGSVIVGQFAQSTGEPEQFGMLFAKGNPFQVCINGTLEALKQLGTVDELEQKWLSDEVSVPVLQ